MTKVTDPTSRAVTLVYDSSGHLVTVKTPSGQEKRFAYDSSGHLTGITDPYGYHLYVNWVRPEAYGTWRVSAVFEKAGGEDISERKAAL